LEYNGTVHQLFVYFKKKHDSFRREVLYNIPTEFGTYMKIDRLIKVCLHETYSKVCTEKNMSDASSIQYDLKQGDALSSLFLTMLYSVPSEKSMKIRKVCN